MARKSRIHILPVFCAVLVLTAALAVAGLWGRRIYRQRYERTYIEIGGQVYSRDISALTLTSQEELAAAAELENLETLDARGIALTGEQYETLRAALPGCEILWNPPFQGAYYSEDTSSLTIASLTAQDIADLAYFPNLTEIDATECQEYAQLAALAAAYPDCCVTYYIRIGGERYAPDTQSLTLEDADVLELAERLPYFTALESVALSGELPPAEDLIALTQALPQTAFSWDVTILGETYPHTTTELDFSDIPLDGVEEIESGAAYLPDLTKVIMCNCGIDNETMDALNRRHEDVQYVWTVQLGTFSVRTDETTLMPARYNCLLNNTQAQNIRYLTELVVLDLGHHQKVTDGSFLQYLTKLEFLLLGDSGISDISGVSNMPKLRYVELFMTPVTDYTPLLSCTELEDLNLYYTFGDPEVVVQMTWLKRLWWGLSGMTTAEIEVYKTRFPDTVETNFYHSEATSGGWRKGKLYYEMRDLLGLGYMD